jgi:sugar lactone lactonase YvrE
MVDTFHFMFRHLTVCLVFELFLSPGREQGREHPPLQANTVTQIGGYPEALFVDATNVFWIERPDGKESRLLTVPKSGGKARTLGRRMTGIALAGRSIFVAYYGTQEKGDDLGRPGYIARIAKPGGPKKILKRSNGGGFNALRADASHIYWVNTLEGTVCKMSRRGGRTLILADVPPNPTRLTLDENFVYWTNEQQILRVSKTGGDVLVLATGEGGMRGGVAVDNSYVYWSDNYSKTINRVPKNGGAVSVVASGLSNPLDLVVDEKSVYWVDIGDALVMMSPVNGGRPQVLAQGGAPRRIALDQTFVYWADSSEQGFVHRIPKNATAKNQSKNL